MAFLNCRENICIFQDQTYSTNEKGKSLYMCIIIQLQHVKHIWLYLSLFLLKCLLNIPYKTIIIDVLFHCDTFCIIYRGISVRNPILVEIELCFLSHTIAYTIITRKQSFHSSLRCSNFITFSRGKIRKANLTNLFFLLHRPVLRCFVTCLQLVFIVASQRKCIILEMLVW